MSDCPKCHGKGSYMYDENHGKPCSTSTRRRTSMSDEQAKIIAGGLHKLGKSIGGGIAFAGLILAWAIFFWSIAA